MFSALSFICFQIPSNSGSDSVSNSIPSNRCLPIPFPARKKFRFRFSVRFRHKNMLLAVPIPIPTKNLFQIGHYESVGTAAKRAR